MTLTEDLFIQCRYRLNSIESGNLVFTFDVVDASGNSITLTYDERFVDSSRQRSTYTLHLSN